VGVPIVLGNGGMEKVIEISLTDDEGGLQQVRRGRAGSDAKLPA